MTKNSYINSDTIVAPATVAGNAALSIIRISGQRAFKIVDQIFRSNTKLENVLSWRAVLGKIFDESREIDEVVVIKYQNPHSYTTEDMIEISCHGGYYVSQKILELLIKFGARLAEPGEFTLRAFLNGRIDLVQAEAIADIIKAQTESGHSISINQLNGKLSEKISAIRNLLLDSCSLLELELDFSEEDLEFLNRSDFIKKLNQIENELEELISTFNQGRLARDGVKVVITGKPNVGKSSLLNLLTNEERAIVTDIPGTTRDSLEVQLDINGIWFRIFDTAGMTFSTDPIEAEGIKRAQQHLESADIILHLFDGSTSLENEDFWLIKRLNELSGKKIIRLINKTDLPQKLEPSVLFDDPVKILSISVLRKLGVEELKQMIFDTIRGGDTLFYEQPLISNMRHWSALNHCLTNLRSAKDEIGKKSSAEFIAVFLREALDDLGQIVGTVTSEDILNHIFSKFCIGK